MSRQLGIRTEWQGAGIRVVDVAYAPYERRRRTDCPDFQLWWARAGGWTSAHRDATEELLPGQVALYLPRQPSVQSVARHGVTLLSVQLAPSILERGQSIRRSGLALGMARVQQALWESRGDDTIGVEESVLALINSETRPESQRPAWLRGVQARLDAEFSQTHSLTALATEVGVHVVYLASTFRAQLGCTIGEYQRRLRLEAAIHQLTTTEDNLASIASATGFYDQAHLTRHFRRALGVPPARFRQKLRA